MAFVQYEPEEELPDFSNLRRGSSSRELPIDLTGFFSPAGSGVMTAAEPMAPAERPAFLQPPVDRLRGRTAVEPTPPFKPLPPLPGPGPEMREPSRNPITNQIEFTPFAPEPASIAGQLAQVPGALGRGSREVGLSWLGGLTVAGDLATGDNVTSAVRGAIKDIGRESRGVQAQMGGDSATVKAAEGLPKVAAYMAASSSRLPLLATMMLMQPDAAQKYHDYRRLGNDPLEAFIASQGTALAEVLPERVGWNALVKLFRLPQGTSKVQFLKSLGIQQATEHTEEQITNVSRWAIDRAMKDPSATSERLWADAKETFVGTALTLPVLSGGALAARGIQHGAQRLEERYAPGRALGRALGEDVAGGEFTPEGIAEQVRRSMSPDAAQRERRGPFPATPLEPGMTFEAQRLTPDEMLARDIALTGAPPAPQGQTQQGRQDGAPLDELPALLREWYDPEYGLVGQRERDEGPPPPRKTQTFGESKTVIRPSPQAEALKALHGKYPWDMGEDEFFNRVANPLLRKQYPGRDITFLKVQSRKLLNQIKESSRQLQSPAEAGMVGMGDVSMEGNLGIRRPDMPQIRPSDTPAFDKFAAERGVRVTMSTMDPQKLRPSQNEIRTGTKISDMPADIADAPITVSNDGYVLDGHHRWAAHVEADTPTMNVRVIDLPAREALDLMRSFPLTYSRTMHQLRANRAAPAPVDESTIVNPISRTGEATPEQQVEELKALTAQTQPVLRGVMREIMETFPGTEAKDNVKRPETIASKVRRPQVLARKPWMGVEHIRDSYRFKITLDELAQLPHIAKLLVDRGFEIVKEDFGMLAEHKGWGWRAAVLDLRAPTGQLVELYIAPAEVIEANQNVAHLLFENWRNEDLAALSPSAYEAMEKDRAASLEAYDKAVNAYLKRTDQTEDDVRNAVKSARTMLASLISTNSSARSPTVSSPRLSERQRPDSSRTALTSGDVSTMRDPSTSLNATGSTSDSLPQGAPHGIRALQAAGANQAAEGGSRQAAGEGAAAGQTTAAGQVAAPADAERTQIVEGRFDPEEIARTRRGPARALEGQRTFPAVGATVKKGAWGADMLRDLKSPHSGERAVINRVLQRLVEEFGIPEALINDINTILTHSDESTGGLTDGNAAYFPDYHMVSINRKDLRQSINNEGYDRVIATALAHELGHSLDADPVNPSHSHKRFGSSNSPRMALEFRGTGPVVLDMRPGPSADLMLEIFQAAGINDRIAAHFAYPFGLIMQGRHDPRHGPLEAFAQAHAFYFLERELVRQHMPKWFELFEGVYGQVAGEFQVDQARARLFAALQYQNPSGSSQVGVAGGAQPAGGGQPYRAGAPRGPPGAGVGGIAAAGTRDEAAQQDGGSDVGRGPNFFNAFVSRTARVIEGLKENEMTARQWAARIRNLPGVPKAELEDTGLLRVLESNPDNKLTKSEVLEGLPVGVKPVPFNDPDAEVEDEEPDWEWISNRAYELAEEAISSQIRNEMPEEIKVEVRREDANLTPDLFTGETTPDKFFAVLTTQGAGRMREYPRPDSDHNEHFDYEHDPDYGFKTDDPDVDGGVKNLGPFDTYAQAERAGVNERRDIEAEEYDKRFDYAMADGTPDAFVDEAQEEWQDSNPRSTSPVNREIPFAAYTVRGGHNYGTTFVTAPHGRDQWRDGHDDYGHIKNPVVRLRHKDRLSQDGNSKILFIEEMQPPSKRMQSKMPKHIIAQWKELGFKQALMMAAEGAYDGIAWTTGHQQAKHYNLSEHVDSISITQQGEETYRMRARRGGRVAVDRANLTKQDLEEHIGGPLATSLIDELKVKAEPTVDSAHPAFRDAAEKMKAGLVRLYDETFPKVLNDVLKKAGLKERSGTVDLAGGLPKQPGAILSPESLDQVQKTGLPVFSGGTPAVGTETGPITLPGKGDTFPGVSAKPDERDWSRNMKNGLSALNQSQQAIVEAALTDLVAAGIPRFLIDSVQSFTSYDTFYSGYKAVWFSTLNQMGIHKKVIAQALGGPEGARNLRRYIAHELGHALDTTGKAVRLDPGAMFQSTTSPRLEALPGIQAAGAQADLLVEIYVAMGMNPKLGEYFAYPFDLLLDGKLPQEVGPTEYLAQAHALYFSEPLVVKEFLPTWYAIFGQIYGTQTTQATQDTKPVAPPRNLQEARERLQQALLPDQGAGADTQTGSGASVADIQGREPVATGSARGPPRRGVGEGAANRPAGGGQRERLVAGADRGNEPPSVGAQQPPRATGAAGGPTRATATVSQPGWWDNLLREWQDNQIDTKRVERAIERQHGAIFERQDPYMGETLFHGASADRVRRFTQRQVTPLLEAIRGAKLTLEDVGLYLWARHAPQRNVVMARRNPGGPANLSGMFDSARAATAAGQPGALDAQTVMRDARRDPAKFRNLQRIAGMIDAVTKSTRDLLVREGLADRDEIRGWERAFGPHYVPLFRDTEDMTGSTGRGFEIRGRESKSAVGSTREAQSIVAAVIGQHERAIVRAEKAHVGRQLVKLAETYPDPDFWRVDSPPQQRVLNQQTGLVQTQTDPLWKQREDVFLVKDKDARGRVTERAVVFNDRNPRALAMAKAMKNLDLVKIGGISKLFMHVTRYFARLATSWNPEFWATNFARDVQTAGVNLQSTPLKGRAPQVLARIPQALGAMVGNGPSAHYYNELRALGGTTGFMAGYESLKDRNVELAKEIERQMRSGFDPRKWGQWSLEMVDAANTVIENATRLAAYIEAREQGMTQRRAAQLAKELTVNFNRKGNRGASMNAWYMFSKASINGTARLIETLTSPTGRARALAMVGIMTAIGAIMEMFNRMVGGEEPDEEGNNPYDLIPEDTKQKNLIFMLPGGTYAKLPLPYGFNVFVGAGRMTMETILAHGDSGLVATPKNAPQQAWNFVKMMTESFIPLGGTGSLLQMAAPTIADPAVQYLENKTWFGAPLRPTQQDFGPPKPNSRQSFKGTGETAKDLSKWLSDATGGDEVRGGVIDIGPTTLEHIFTTLTGGTGRSLLGMFDAAKHYVKRARGEATAEEAPPLQKIPFVGRFSGEITDQDRIGHFNRLRYGDAFTRGATEQQKIESAYEKRGEFDKLFREKEENPGLSAMGEYLISKEFRDATKSTRERLEEIDKLPREERAEAKRLLNRENAESYIAEAVRRYNDMQRARP